MKILISAAETSSDAHGAELLKAIRNQWDEDGPSRQDGENEVSGQLRRCTAFGIGGPKLQAAGLQTIVDARELLAMGFTEILGRLPRIRRALGQITEAADREKPDLAILIDYPDFHFRLARKLKKLGVPLIYYIPPKVWAWRRSRVEDLRSLFIRVLCILPFEEEFYKNLNIPVKYVGNPLVDELPLELTREDARRKLSLSLSDQVLILMPGSRASELKAHLSLMLESAGIAAQRLRSMGVLGPQEKLKILMPLPLTVSLDSVSEKVREIPLVPLIDGALDIRISQGDAASCLVAADAGLIKSGTSTLEAGLLQCPHSIVYKPTRTTAWIFKNLIRYRGPVGLVNLVAGWRSDGKYTGDYLVREILCEQVTLDSLADEIVALMTEKVKREKLLRGFVALREAICGKGVRHTPSVSAAREVIEVFRGLQAKPR